MIECGRKIEVTIEKLIIGGAGLGRYGNFVVIVPYAVPRDKLLVKVIEVKKNFARAEIVSILSPSPHRITPACPFHFLTERDSAVMHRFHCGGCSLQMIEYEKQLEFKTAIIQKFFSLKVNKTIPSDSQFGYRNKIQMPLGGSAGKVIMGFFHPQSHKIVDIKNCLLQTKKANNIISEIKSLINEYKIQPYNEDTRTGVLRHIILRQSAAYNEFMLVFVSRARYIPNIKGVVDKIIKRFPEIKVVYQNTNPEKTNVILGTKNLKLFGKNAIKEKLNDTVFEISPFSFFQINTEQTIKLYEVIKSFARLKGDENVIDVYSGAGGISLYLAPYCKKVTGIEEVSSAVSDAVKNAKLNNIKNALFIRGNADYVLRKAQFSPKGSIQTETSVVFLNPPRAGCSKDVLFSLLKLLPKKIVYTSCNPATLSRDVKLISRDYKLLEIQPVDMFPQTPHVECVVALASKFS